MSNDVKVTQEDREAAENYIKAGYTEWHSGIGDDYVRAERIALGLADDGELVQAFARHRARHQPQREAVLDEAVVRTFAEGLWAEARKRGDMRPEFMPSSRTDFLDEARKQLTSLTTSAPAAEREAVMKIGNDTCPKCLAAHPVTFDCGQTINVRTASQPEREAVSVEEAAQRIFEHYAFGTWVPGEKPAWDPNGNSRMQDLARSFARAALTTPAPAEPTPVGDVVSRDEM